MFDNTDIRSSAGASEITLNSQQLQEGHSDTSIDHFQSDSVSLTIIGQADKLIISNVVFTK